MKIILNNKKEIRSVDYLESMFYDLPSIEIYILKTFNTDNILLKIDNYASFSLKKINEDKTYGIYKIDFSTNVFLEKSTYNITLTDKVWESNALSINLNKVTYTLRQSKPDVSLLRMKTFSPINNTTSNNVVNKEIISDFSQTIVKGDINSTVIKFHLNKFYDNENLFTKKCSIEMINSKGEKAIQEIQDVVDNQDNTITVSWRLNEFATKEKDTLLFILCFSNLNYDYVWQTKVSSFLVKDQLLVRTSDILDYKKELEEWLKKHPDSESTSMIDEHPTLLVEGRTILIDGNQNTIIEGENNSQLLSFRIKRFQDNIDLSQKVITIKYINANGEGYRTGVVNKSIEDEYITFAWQISSNVTQKDGTVAFAIEIIGKINDSSQDYYIWQTLPSYIQVSEGLNFTFVEETPPDWYQNILNSLITFDQKVSVLESESNIIYWEDF